MTTLVFGPRLRRFESRLHRWLTRNHSDYTRQSKIEGKQIFIVPTRAGLCLGLLCFVMLLTALNYMNSMALMFTFFIAGLAFVSAWHTHRNLRDLELSIGPQPNGFCGSEGGFRIQVHNPTTRPRFGLIFRERNDNMQLYDLAENERIEVTLPLRPDRRGWFTLRRFAITTRMPGGLFNAWAWQTLDSGFWAYPKPLATAAPPYAKGASEGDSQTVSRQQEEEISYLKEYAAGDPVRRVAWKHYARHGRLLVRELDENEGTNGLLSFARLENFDNEEKLSILSYWVVELSFRGETFGLELPGLEIAPGNGEAHAQQCLLELAKFSG